MQQAPDYAELLDVPFAYRSNGRPHPTLAEHHHIIAYVAYRMFVVDASEQSLAAVRAIPPSSSPLYPRRKKPRSPKFFLVACLISSRPYFATDGAYTRASSNMSRSRSR